MRKVILIFAVFLAACAGAETDAAPETETSSPTTAAEQGAPPETQAPVEVPAETSADGSADPLVPAGEIVLTIGDEIWMFEGALCEWLEFQPGSPEFEAATADQGMPSNWTISNVSNGLLISASGFAGVGILDVANFPQTVSWQSSERSFSFDGDAVSFTGNFMDFSDQASQSSLEGTLTARCSWVEVGGLDQFTDLLG